MTRTIITAAALAFAAMLPATHAAARDRVFVASYGNNSNPCTFGSPCKTFQTAVDVVAPGGEVTAIDSAGFGPITINNKAVTITSPNGVEASIAAALGADAIDINAGSSDKVSLQGLTLDGTNIGNNGIVFSGGGALEVINCTVRSFATDGLSLVSTATSGRSLTVSNSRFVDNGGSGISITVDSSGPVSADIDHTSLSGNTGSGLLSTGTNGTGALTIGVTDSVAAHNGGGGFFVSSATSHSVSNLSVTHSLSVSNAFGVEAGGPNSFLWLAQSTLTGNETSFFAGGVGEGEVVTYGDNYVSAANGAPVGSFTTGTKQ